MSLVRPYILITKAIIYSRYGSISSYFVSIGFSLVDQERLRLNIMKKTDYATRLNDKDSGFMDSTDNANRVMGSSMGSMIKRRVEYTNVSQ
jgi:hypothetical protein